MKKLFLILPLFVVSYLILLGAINSAANRENSISDTLLKWEPYAASKEFSEYNKQEREIIRKHWFKKNVECLPEFQTLSNNKQNEIFNCFIQKSLAIEKYFAAPLNTSAMKSAAHQGYAPAQCALGIAYLEGQGFPQNYIYAYAWLSLAAAQGYVFADKQRDLVAEILTRNQIVLAQDIAATLYGKINEKDIYTIPDHTREPHPNIFGTGFLVTNEGYILTCYHVVAGASSVKVKLEDKVYPATTVKVDAVNDLAMIKISGSFKALAFSRGSTKMGQEVYTIGYPNPDLQGMNPKLTKGEINSLTGFQDDIRLYQVSVAVQPGNSGGPLFDLNGNVVGVIVAMLDAQKAYKISGSLPQNVNYAIKSSYAMAFLSSMPEVYKKIPPPLGKHPFEKVIETVGRAVVMVLSYQNI